MAVSFPGCDEGTCSLRHFDRNGTQDGPRYTRERGTKMKPEICISAIPRHLI